MTHRIDPTSNAWCSPRWTEVEADHWLLYQAQEVVGEVYLREEGHIKWHCMTSDERDTSALTIEQAKAECIASFWKDAFLDLQEKARTPLGVG